MSSDTPTIIKDINGEPLHNGDIVKLSNNGVVAYGIVSPTTYDKLLWSKLSKKSISNNISNGLSVKFYNIHYRDTYPFDELFICIPSSIKTWSVEKTNDMDAVQFKLIFSELISHFDSGEDL